MKTFKLDIDLVEYTATNDGKEWTLHDCANLFPNMLKYPDNEYFQYEGMQHHVACGDISEGELTFTAHDEASGSFGWFIGCIEQFKASWDSVGRDTLEGEK